MSDRQRLSQTATFWKHCRKYFDDYGGWSSILTSPFFYGAIMASILSYPMWGNDRWTEQVFQVIPNLLGFSLGTYALLFSLMSNSIKNSLKRVKNPRNKPYIDEINATFLHFIFMQILAFLWAFGYKQTIITEIHNFLRDQSLCKWNFMPFLRDFGSFVGLGLFMYSFLLTVAASLAVYRIARLSEPE